MTDDLLALFLPRKSGFFRVAPVWTGGLTVPLCRGQKISRARRRRNKRGTPTHEDMNVCCPVADDARSRKVDNSCRHLDGQTRNTFRIGGQQAMSSLNVGRVVKLK